MFRGSKPNITNINVLLEGGGLGDILCYLMTVNYIKTHLTYLNPFVYVPNYLREFARHVLPEGTIIRNYTKAAKDFDDTLPGVRTSWLGQHTPMATHPVDYGFHVLVDRHMYDNEHRNYLKIKPDEIDVSRFNLPKYYAIIVPTAAERVKRFPSGVVDDISDYLNSIGVTPVYLGKTETDVGVDNRVIKSESNKFDDTKGINLLDKTSLLEAAKIMHSSQVMVAMDGGLVHLGGFTDCKMIVGYTFASPSHLMPIRNNIQGFNITPITPNESLACRFCQTNMSLLFDHDFRNCYYDDFACATQMTSDKFIQALKGVFK